MTNTELVNAPANALTNLERQRRYVLMVSLTRRECPACFALPSLIEATGKPLDEYDTNRSGEPDLFCPSCKTKLLWVVPLCGDPHFVMDRAWYMGRELTRHGLPQYKTVGDSSVRPEHQEK